MSEPDASRIEPDRRAERRADLWGDFLRRMLLGASIAGTALPVVAAATEEVAPVEAAELEPVAVARAG